VSKRVLVQEFLHGMPLSRAREQMKQRGVDPDSPEARLFGRRLLSALTTVFGRSILETGFFHADPHPGNIFVLEDGRFGLIDFGQVKQISGRNRETLCKVMIALDERPDGWEEDPSSLQLVGDLSLELGVELKDGAPVEAAAAVGMWLFDGTVENLPGGYDKGELSPNSPVRELKSFPQDLVLVGRSSILIKGISSRLGVPWSLAKQWAPIARQVLSANYQNTAESSLDGDATGRVRFREVLFSLKQWGKGRATRLVRKLPPPLRTRVANIILKMEERKSRRALMKREKYFK
jgi:aarF domain-containing kinase